jgi:hypothetical protein
MSSGDACLKRTSTGKIWRLKNQSRCNSKKYGAKELGTDYYSIQNNQFATNAALLSQKDIASLNKLTVRGAEEYTICPPTMGRKNLTNVIIKSVKNNMTIDPKINVRLNSVLVNYK